MVMQMGVFFHVSQEHSFKDENVFYRFTSSRRLLSLHQNFWNVRGSFDMVYCVKETSRLLQSCQFGIGDPYVSS